MPDGHTKFSGSWLSYHDSNGQKLNEWCKKGKDDYNGYCCLCKVDIKCNHAGKPNCYNMQRGRNILKSLSTCKANCFSVIVKPQVQVKEDLALVKEDPALVKEDLALVSQNMVKPHKNKAWVLLNPALLLLSVAFFLWWCFAHGGDLLVS